MILTTSKVLTEVFDAVTKALRITAVVNANGAFQSQAVTSTPTAFAPPANAVGFILEAESANTDNVRWCIGATASTTNGVLAEPGRDTGFIPCAASISVAAVSGTQTVGVQWVLSS